MVLFWVHCVLKQHVWEALYKTSINWKNWVLHSKLRTKKVLSWWQWENWFWNTKTAMTSIDRKALYYIHTTVLHSNKRTHSRVHVQNSREHIWYCYHARREACTLLVMFTPKFVTKKGSFSDHFVLSNCVHVFISIYFSLLLKILIFHVCMYHVYL